MKVRVRSYGYAFAVITLLLIAGWAGRIAWLEFRQLSRSFGSVQADAFQLSDRVKVSIRDLNDLVLRFERDGHPEDRTAFEKKSQDLRGWIRFRRPAVTTSKEQDLLEEIQGAEENYASRMSKLMDERERVGTVNWPTPLVKQVETESAPVLALCEKLGIAEGAAQTQFMDASHRALISLQQLMIVQMGLLVILIGTAVVAVYRGVIGPLRIELGKSRARATRHEKLASLGTLAAGVAHEIRNPLTAINVRLHSLKKNLVTNSSENEDALVIGHEIQRLERIVQEFLQFARPGEPKPFTVSIDSLFARMQSLFGPQLEKTSIQLKLESPPDVWVRVDPHQIEQVLINLVQNSAESIDGNGSIILRVRSQTARPQGRTGPVVILEVIDTGKGIPPEVRNRIFDPFFTTKEEGTGLGLAVSARIVEKHGGTLECRSELDRGTTFTITLPRAEPEKSYDSST